MSWKTHQEGNAGVAPAPLGAESMLLCYQGEARQADSDKCRVASPSFDSKAALVKRWVEQPFGADDRWFGARKNRMMSP